MVSRFLERSLRRNLPLYVYVSVNELYGGEEEFVVEEKTHGGSKLTIKKSSGHLQTRKRLVTENDETGNPSNSTEGSVQPSAPCFQAKS